MAEVRAGWQSCSDPVQPQDVIVGELSENIDSMHSASNKAKWILLYACVSSVLWLLELECARQMKRQ